MPEVVTFTHLFLACAGLVGLMAVWPVRQAARGRRDAREVIAAATAQQDKEIAQRLGAHDRDITQALTEVRSALDAANRNHEYLQTLHGLVLDLRADVVAARRSHPPEQHPRTERELEKIRADIAKLDDKMDLLLAERRSRANTWPGPGGSA